MPLELGAVQAVEQFEQDVVEFDGDGGFGVDVMLVSPFAPYRLAYPVFHDRPLIYASRKIVKHLSCLSKGCRESL